MKKRIMVVDDDIINIKTCSFALLQHDYEPVPLDSGMECLKYLQDLNSPPVDLILLDIEMPFMNGLATLESIRKIPTYKNMPVMMLTSTATEDVVRQAMRLNVVSYLKKPFLPKDLLDRVDKYFSGKL